MLERMCVRQLSVRDVTADEYLPEVKNLFRRVDEGVDDFEVRDMRHKDDTSV